MTRPASLLFPVAALLASATLGCKKDDPYCCALRTFHAECQRRLGEGDAYEELDELADEGDEAACKAAYDEIRDSYGCRSSASEPFFEPPDALAMCGD